MNMPQKSLGDTLRDNGLFAKKSLGQHFLLDINLTSKIARLANLSADDVAIEIGPGPGGLTQALLNSKAAKIIVIEKDSRFCEHLRQYFANQLDRLIIIEGDALKIKIQNLLQEYNLENLNPKIIANLPYNVGTQILINWLENIEWQWPMVLMFQTEVAMRICAKTNENHYGRLAILVNARTIAHIGMHIPRLAFTPPPKVESAVVVLEPKPNPFQNIKALGKITQAAFSQRRKMLRSSLKSIPNSQHLLEIANIDGQMRAEQISPQGFFDMARVLNDG